MAKETLRCSKCFVTLDRLKEDGVCDFLVTITKKDGKKGHICPVCLAGW